MKTLIIFTIVFFHCQLLDQYCSEAKLLNKNKFKEQISEDSVLLVDVRTKNEYINGHIENAYHADVLLESDFKNKFTEFNKEKPIYIYCRSGARSKMAAQLLCEMGFKKIYDLKGGYLTWQ